MIGGMIAFLAIVYVYSYLKYKKNKRQTIDTVAEFKKKYLKDKNINPKRNLVNNGGCNTGSLHNERLDYIERSELIEASQKLKEIEKPSRLT